jgi:hypothetical protein
MNAGGWKHDSNEHSLRAADRAMGPQRAALQVPSINRCIDPTVAVKKLLRHGAGLFIVQMFVGLVMFAVAILSDMWYGFSVWYTDAGAGGKLHHMQYAWAVFNVLSACWGMKVYIAWQDPTEGTRQASILHTRYMIFAGYWTWAFGVWTTAVLFYSFSSYSFDGEYPVELTGLFLAAAVCCLISDTWSLGKLCSLSTYCAHLQEEWRRVPHGPSHGIADPEEGGVTAEMANRASARRVSNAFRCGYLTYQCVRLRASLSKPSVAATLLMMYIAAVCNKPAQASTCVSVSVLSFNLLKQ